MVERILVKNTHNYDNERIERPMWHVGPIIWGQKEEKFGICKI